jgi:FAD/FMN-containing dehydrogenase
VGAGVTLAAVHAAAASAGRRFPLDFGARDSATVGGMVATNAGGVHALRHGMMRRRVVGLEWVGADGTVVRRMLGLVKDNTGYDLTGLMCGSEGTLGIVTAARLQLEPDPRFVVTALVEAASIDAALAAAAACRRVRSVEAVEFMAAECRPGSAGPSLLVECASDHDPLEDLGAVLDGCEGIGSTQVATDGPRRQALWAVRDGIPAAILRAGVPIKVDVAVPVPALGPFLAAVSPLVTAVAADAKVWRFGHAGDGNIHVNVTGCDPHGPVADAVEEAVLRLAVDHGGTISAEHGVGMAKTRWLSLSRSAAELDALAAIKAALDPTSVFNPGVLGLG